MTRTRVPRYLRAAGRVSLITAPNPAPFLPAAKSDGRPAFITSAVIDILGSARSFRQWVADHAEAFLEGPASHEA
jgi:hypothetical protein